MAEGDTISGVGKPVRRGLGHSTLVQKVAAVGSAARRIVRALVAPGMSDAEEPRSSSRADRRATASGIPRLEVWGERRDRPNKSL